MPRFSVIIPAYNEEQTIVKALDSVEAQTFTDYEIVVTDDGSTDATGEVIDRWQEEHQNIGLIHIQQKNKGLGAARNSAIQKATGDYLAFLDADDQWLPHKLSQANECLERRPKTDLMYHRVWEVYGKEKRKRKAWQVLSMEDIFIRGNPIIPSATFVRRGCLDEAGGFSEDRRFHGVEDFMLWVNLLKMKAEFWYWPECLALYSSGVGMSARMDEHLEHISAVFDHCKKEIPLSEEVYERAFRRKHYEAARFYHKTGEIRQAKNYYKRSGMDSLKKSVLYWFASVGIRL